MPKPLSATMAICLAETMEQGGKLVRFADGYWTWQGLNSDSINRFRDATVHALVSRGEIEFTNWRGNHPIAAQVKARAP